MYGCAASREGYLTCLCALTSPDGCSLDSNSGIVDGYLRVLVMCVCSVVASVVELCHLYVADGCPKGGYTMWYHVDLVCGTEVA